MKSSISRGKKVLRRKGERGNLQKTSLKGKGSSYKERGEDFRRKRLKARKKKRTSSAPREKEGKVTMESSELPKS